jgi:hypothetical protein
MPQARPPLNRVPGVLGRRKIISIGLLALLLAGPIAFVGPMLSGARADHARVDSIKDTPEYQNPALLKQAWELPVASLYQRNIDYQRNPSVCGPTSLVNVLHSFELPGDQEQVCRARG